MFFFMNRKKLVVYKNNEGAPLQYKTMTDFYATSHVNAFFSLAMKLKLKQAYRVRCIQRYKANKKRTNAFKIFAYLEFDRSSFYFCMNGGIFISLWPSS
jgi:hypothetical protein